VLQADAAQGDALVATAKLNKKSPPQAPRLRVDASECVTVWRTDRVTKMRFTNSGARALAGFAALAFACVPTLVPGTARGADAKSFVMKFTFPTINDQVHQFAKNYAAAVEKDSGGRIKAELYPASQLGSIPRQIEGVQFGAIQCAIIPPEFFVGIDERFQLLAAPGLITSFAHGQRVAGDPAVLKIMLGLGADKGLRFPLR